MVKPAADSAYNGDFRKALVDGIADAGHGVRIILVHGQTDDLANWIFRRGHGIKISDQQIGPYAFAHGESVSAVRAQNEIIVP